MDLVIRASPTKSAFVTVPNLDLNLNSPLRSISLPSLLFVPLLSLASYPIPPRLCKTNNGCPSGVNIGIFSVGAVTIEAALGRTKAVAAAEAVLLLQQFIFYVGKSKVGAMAMDELEEEQPESSLDGFGTPSGFVDGNIVRGW